ncbi:MAG: calcium-binding protein [Alphaproteobacteria bacterium]|jgi:Ca2+-binding EF-hand superfamily protein|nr:MAG: calcium-binding protein [Alphaproteobacteria bacterium]
MKLRLIAATAVLALLAGSAVAQPPAGPGRGPGPGGFGLLEFDGNADGKLTKTEFDAGQRARFDKIDANKDGSITREERAAYFKADADARRAEVTKTRFADLDKDKNGQLSQSEFSAGGARADGKGPGRHHGGRSMGGNPERVRADADKDAKTSFADFSARGAEAFARADANKDGTVTIAELQALKPARK